MQAKINLCGLHHPEDLIDDSPITDPEVDFASLISFKT